MFVLGLNGSPRRKGNNDYLLSLFMDEAEKRGCATHTIAAAFESYEPCIGCGYCEKKGLCSIKDDMARDLFSLMRKADVIVLASPVYFYGVPARIKGIIDRIQTLWSRKYRFNLKDPGAEYRKGILLSVGATHGKNLFDGIRLTTRYFFDAMDCTYDRELCYPGIDDRGAIAAHPGVKDDVKRLADKVLTPFQQRKRILFACRENAGRSQMAAGFARQLAGDAYDVISAGSSPAQTINPLAVEAMARKGIDIAFNQPCSMDDALALGNVEIIVTMGCGEACPIIPGCKVVEWDLPDPAEKPLEAVCDIRDEILERVKSLLC
ncbi:Low molecular weight phosphotyrosine protein phosphatase [Desulfocicer vacuolatum DSM 3385]|uniref:Low molecular weight phosphotyrosine protein phosphatase n=1 Tax=Desulfocicer vacuolatum DSM 3385 TaxID=1121400 RepID=A0A1W2A364_9BACT|nr:NAD(P)H-dependent oxidoreductase [Desulfocicer vacuolatum]SMC55104.1 Low molecular weight phosphotyrosine protein phosphatase [Desulfocicer vacuolatum DSM 3385]